MATIDEIEIPSLLFSEEAAPTTPATGFGRLYVKTTGLFFMGDDGVEVGPLAAASGGAGTLAAAAYTRTAGDYTTTSTSFVDVDATNLALAITTGASRVLVGLVADCENSTNLASVYLDVDVDGTRLGGTNGIHRQVHTNGTIPNNASFTWMTEALTAASHTFKLQWKVGSGTGKLYGSSASTQLRFWVKELA